MRPIHVITFCVALAFSSVAFAQSDATRRVVAEIERQLPRMSRVSTVAKQPGVEYQSEVKAWADMGGLRKLEITDRHDSGDVIAHYYYLKGTLIYVYQAVKGVDQAGRRVTVGEERELFTDGRMVLWVSGLAGDIIKPASARFAEEARARRIASAFFVRVSDQAFARAPRR